MAVLLALYVAMHSPLRSALARRFGRPGQGCYFACDGQPDGEQVVAALAALLLLILAVLAARSIVERLVIASYERPLAFGLVALTLVAVPPAWVGAVADWTGTTLLRPPLGPLLSAIPAALVLALAAARRSHGARVARPRAPRPWTGWRRPSGLALVFAASSATLLIASVVVSLTHPPTGYDALGYHAPLSVYFWRDGNLSAFLDRGPARWTWALASPGTVELWAGLLQMIGGEPAANVAQLPFAALGALAVRVFARRLGAPNGAAWLAALAFLQAPIVVGQVGVQLSDLAGAALIMASVALAAAPASAWTRSRLALLGIALGLSTASKLGLLPAVAAVTLLVVVVVVRTRDPAGGGGARVLVAAACFAVAVAPWWGRNTARYGNPVYPVALPFVGRGGYSQADMRVKDRTFVPDRRLWLAYPLLEPHNDQSGFGALFVVGAIPGLIATASARRRRSFRGRPLAPYVAVAATMLPAWWLLVSHEPRFLLSVFGLAFACLPATFSIVPRRQRRRAGALLAAAALFSAAVTFDQAVAPLAHAPSARAQFYDQVWGIDTIVAALPERDGLLYHTGHAMLSYAGDYPLLGPSLARLLIPADGEVPADTIVALMRHAGVRYAYVPAALEAQASVEQMYAAPRFELAHVSTIREGERRGTKRYLFRLRETPAP